MKNKIIIFVVLIAIGVGTYFLFFNKNNESAITKKASIASPERPAEINGSIVSSLGNEIKIANEVDKEILTEEEQAANKAAMQSMTQEERAAARETAKVDIKTEDVTLTIPVGVPVVKGSGDASGNIVSADIAELTKGVYVSIWTDSQGKVEFVKIKGI